MAKILLKAQDEMKEKKMELELSVLSAASQWKHKIIDRATTDAMTASALAEIDNEDVEMN